MRGLIAVTLYFFCAFAFAQDNLPGVGVDSRGGAVVDPTRNVQALSEASNKRQDDLREAERRYNDLRDTNLREVTSLRAEFQKELDVKEAARLDSIRAVDREEVAKALAAQQATAETLRNQVATTAAAAEQRRAADYAEITKRVTALELSGSSTGGKDQGSTAAWTFAVSIGILVIAALGFLASRRFVTKA